MMDDTMMQLVLDRTAKVMNRYHEALERYCRESLAGGQHGVLVIHHGPGEWSMMQHPSVPYGTIHEFPQGILPSVARDLGIDVEALRAGRRWQV